MKTRAIIKVAAVSVMSLGLTAGVFSGVGAQGYSWPPQKPAQSAQTEISVENEAELRLHNSTRQQAVTGSVSVSNDDDDKKSYRDSRHHRDDRRDNQGTVVGDITTGTASNSNSTSAKVSVSNATDVELPAPAPAADNDHHNDRRSNQQQAVANTEVEVENDTEVSICNTTEQSAVSGSVSISGAKTVGDVTTGNASNTNETELNISVSSDTGVN